MITSIIGFIFQGTSSTQTVSYNGQKFTQTNLGYRTIFEKTPYYFAYTPGDVEHLQTPDVAQLRNALQIDLTYDFNSSFKEEIAGSIYEFASVLSNKGIYVRQGFTKNNTYGAPILTCDDATEFLPIFYYRESNKTEVTIENYCIIMNSASPGSFLAYTDKILFQYLGIIENG